MASILARRCFKAAGGAFHRAMPSKTALRVAVAPPLATQPMGFDRFSVRSLSVSIGDAIPAVSLDKGFPPEKVPLDDFCTGKKVVLVGLPGAFTPT